MRAFKHKSKNVFVHAERLTEENVRDLAQECGGTVVEEREDITRRVYSAINVPTPLGPKRLSQGMYLVKFGNDYAVARPGQFQAYYDALTPSELDETNEEPGESTRQILGFGIESYTGFGTPPQ